MKIKSPPRSSDAVKSKVKCRKCGHSMDRIPRTAFLRTYFSWLPIRRYFCYGCLEKRWAKPPEP